MAKAILNSGWYVSQAEYREKFTSATIYAYDADKDMWTNAATGAIVATSNLPETPENMWPLRLVQR